MIPIGWKTSPGGGNWVNGVEGERGATWWVGGGGGAAHDAHGLFEPG